MWTSSDKTCPELECGKCSTAITEKENAFSREICWFFTKLQCKFERAGRAGDGRARWLLIFRTTWAMFTRWIGHPVIEKLNLFLLLRDWSASLPGIGSRETNFSCRCSFPLTRTNISSANNEFSNLNFHRKIFSCRTAGTRHIIYIELDFNLPEYFRYVRAATRTPIAIELLHFVYIKMNPAARSRGLLNDPRSTGLTLNSRWSLSRQGFRGLVPSFSAIEDSIFEFATRQLRLTNYFSDFNAAEDKPAKRGAESIWNVTLTTRSREKMDT